MDIVNKSYFNVIKYSIIVTGLSRHHPMWFNFLAKSFTFFLIFSLLSAQIAGFVKVYGDIDLVLGCCPPICYSSISAIIYVNSNLHVKQINIVFEKIREDWNLLTSESELDILHKYGRKCRAYNLLYTYGLFIQVVLYHSAHGIPLLINILKKNNKPKPLMLPVECGLDSEKYFGLITLHSYVFGYFSTTGIATGGTLLVMFLEHACGIFDIIGHKLIHAIKENINSTNKVVSKKKFRQEIKICVAMHKRIVLFITDIQNVFSTAYLFVYGIKIILLSVTAVQIQQYRLVPFAR
ncbi:uncharacterized protein LOC127283979 isoform X2 [Leptopilina boulardi]|uniref:uncharacterized protein LOC127283979 isoform X2 n=1 Tax=Leptopilina boulardi TaxID=63433 RepID=UPI0021F563C2|nr:uncharacterized protein LOC127283979 isoform X2 [Leptopilina boulardi]